MATVPAYEQQVEAKPLPGFRQESVATPALLGGMADSAQNLGQGVSVAAAGAAAVVYQMQERDNADKVFQAETALKADYLNFEADLRTNRKGAFAKNVTQDAKTWWSEAGKKHIENLDNDAQRKLFIRRMTPLRFSSIDQASKFEAQQLEISHDQSWQANKVGSIDIAAANADEATVRSQITEIKRLNAYQAARKGWDASTLEASNAEDITTLHKQVIQTLVKKNPDAAKTYFDAHKDEIRGSEQAEIGDFATKATAESKGMAAAGDIWKSLGPQTDRDAANLDTMEQKARDQFANDPYTLKATIASIRERFQAFNTGRSEREHNLEAAVNSAILKGANTSQIRQMPEFLQLSPDKARTIDTYMENRAYTRAARADAEESRAARRLSKAGNEAFLVYSNPDALVALGRNEVVNLLPVLGPEQTAALIQRHDALTKSAEALNAARIDNTTFNALAVSAGLHPSKKGMSEEDKDRLVQLRAAVDARLLNANRAAGKPLPPDQRAQIAKQAFDDTVRLPGFFSAWGYGTGADMPVSALTADERAKAIVVLPEGRIRVKDIPPAFVDQAEESLKKAGRPINQKAVAQMWLLNKGSWSASLGRKF